jgi:hypothetical protein
VLKTSWKYVRRHHLGLIALFVALSGTAYAAATIGPRDIKDNAVHSRHIKDGTVSPGDLEFQGVVLTASKQVDYGTLAAHRCTSDQQAVGGLAKSGDLTVVEDTKSPAYFQPGLVISAKAVHYQPLPPPPDNAKVAVAPWTLCNVTDHPIDPPATVLNIAVIRH